ncbi:hypothetical protein JZ751_026422 [Albula glossodonta]|uniref:Uncharacterized protein n=1 Tax=Albula glossodonta TaxID=121402 RepID=A0A8T2PCX4_9TELE|nr:hypothetical protein JZ751_026422 [Albula glossodonta]
MERKREQARERASETEREREREGEQERQEGGGGRESKREQVRSRGRERGRRKSTVKRNKTEKLGSGTEQLPSETKDHTEIKQRLTKPQSCEGGVAGGGEDSGNRGIGLFFQGMSFDGACQSTAGSSEQLASDGSQSSQNLWHSFMRGLALAIRCSFDSAASLWLGALA